MHSLLIALIDINRLDQQNAIIDPVSSSSTVFFLLLALDQWVSYILIIALLPFEEPTHEALLFTVITLGGK